MLCQYKNEVTPRKMILDTLWGDDSFFNSRNLDVYITKLRQYLRYDDRVQILTLKAVGYRLVDQ
jgi:DNA-binding response OmpR family regulator